MNRQAQGALIAFAFVTAFVISVALHSVVAAVTVLLAAVTVAYVVSIAWMRTAPGKRDKRERTH